MGGVAVLVGGGGFLAILGLTVLVLRRRATGEDEAPSPTNPLDHPHQTLTSRKRSRPSTKRFNPLPNNPRPHRWQRSSVDLQFRRGVYPQGGPRNSGNTTVNNTLMGHCESGLLWPNTLQHGTDFGSSSLFVGSARGTYGISRCGFKQPGPRRCSERLRCSPCCCGHGWNFEVGSWKHWPVSKLILFSNSTRAERPCGGQGRGTWKRTRDCREYPDAKWCCGFQNNSVESKVGLQKC